jgi:hypothetical protein
MYDACGVRRLLPLFVVALVTVASASASTPILVFDRPAAAAHSSVVTRTAGTGTLLRVRKRVLRLYLGDIQLGRLSVNRKGNGRLRFDVPNLPAGPYSVLLRGLPGEPASRTVGSFKVIDGPPPIRDCRRSVYGKLTQEYLDRSLAVGPVRLIGFDSERAADPAWAGFAHDRITGEYAVKVLLLVERGSIATLSVVKQDRRMIALSYIPERFNRHRVTAGDAAVRFTACRGNEDEPGAGERFTQFNGGFLFRQPLCAHFELRVEGRPDPVEFGLPFGRAC